MYTLMVGSQSVLESIFDGWREAAAARSEQERSWFFICANRWGWICKSQSYKSIPISAIAFRRQRRFYCNSQHTKQNEFAATSYLKQWKRGLSLSSVACVSSVSTGTSLKIQAENHGCRVLPERMKRVPSLCYAIVLQVDDVSAFHPKDDSSHVVSTTGDSCNV